MISKLSRFFRLPPSERPTLLAASLLFPLFWLGLHALGLAGFQRWLERGRVRVPARPSKASPEDLARLVNLAAAHSPVPANCLARSLLLEWMLRRQGVVAQLRIGVRLESGSLRAHAWLECEGRPINDSADVAQQFPAFSGQVAARRFSARSEG